MKEFITNKTLTLTLILHCLEDLLDSSDINKRDSPCEILYDSPHSATPVGSQKSKYFYVVIMVWYDVDGMTWY